MLILLSLLGSQLLLIVRAALAHVQGGMMEPSFDFINDEVYSKPVEFMAAAPLSDPQKSAHMKDETFKQGQLNPEGSLDGPWAAFDFSKFDNTLGTFQERDHNRLKRKAKRRRGRVGRRRNRNRSSSVPPDDAYRKNVTATSEVPIARRGDHLLRQGKRAKKKQEKQNFDMYEPKIKEYEADFVEMPKDLYQAHLRPGVIFRIHMSEAILKMQYRNYGENKDESVIEADVEYLRLTRKVINDEITKFEDLKWLIGWFNNRSELVQEHMCNTRYFTVGIPPTMFTHTEEYMKRMCLFDNVYIDHIPYVVGEDFSLMAAVAPPVLHCDAATCTSVPFIDSLMFDERLPRTNVRTVTRCQASCRAHCRNDPDCLKRCSDRCLRAET